MSGKKLTERTVKWQLCYDMTARTWWMVRQALFLFRFLSVPHYIVLYQPLYITINVIDVNEQ